MNDNFFLIGDFHFLWECLRVLFHIFWGTPSQVGSLCNMWEAIRLTQVDNTANVFNVGDEFVMHVFKAHLKASICQLLKVTAPTVNIPHLCTQQWLHDRADMIVKSAVMPTKTIDPIYSLHRAPWIPLR